MKDQFVTYEIALKLKKLGFNEISRFGQETSLYTKEGKHTFYANYGFMGSGLRGGYIYAPLWQQTIDWFKEKYNIHIEITHHVTEQYDINYKYYVIKNPVDCIECYENAYYKTYEKVREQAILKAIELCKR